MTAYEKTALNATTFWMLVVLSLVMANVPLLDLLLGPINTFTTMIHEMSHALVCIMTGGYVNGLTIVSDGSGHGGLTFCRGGLPFFYTQAGYLGTAFFGSFLIFIGQYPRLSKGVLCAIGAAMGLASVLLVGGGLLNTGWQGFFSMLWGFAMSAILIYAGMKWSASAANTLLLFLAIQTALNSVSSIFILVKIALGLVPFSSFSDATGMYELTGIPAGVWSFFWVIASIAMVYFTMRFTYGRGLLKGR